MTEALNNVITRLWDWVDARQVVRRIIVLGTWIITIHLIVTLVQWAIDPLNTRPGSDIAMILGAAMTPITILQGFVTQFYFNTRGAT